MKRRPSPSAASSGVKPETDLAGQVRRLMSGGRWREAVETCKQLIKQDPTGGWESSLAWSYEGRAGELAGKGMFKEAIILLDNAERLVAKIDTLPLRLNCLVAIGRIEQAVLLYLREEERLMASMPDLFPVTQEYVAVLLLTKPVLEASLPVESPWRSQLTAARQALFAVSSPHAELERLLSRISLRSPFKPLRLILKALVLVRDQPDKALQLVSIVPDTSPWSALRRLVSLCAMDWEVLLRRIGEFGNQELEVVCTWRGISSESWRRVRELLAAPASRLLSALLDPAARWPVPEQQIRRLAWLSLVEAPGSLPQFERRFGVLDPAEKSRLSALSRERIRPHEGISAWNGYLRQLMTLPESSDRNLRVAMTHRYLAALIGRQDDEDPTIESHLEQSLVFDPGHRKSHQALIAWHQGREDDQAGRRVLDRALRSFPGDADFLHEAVRQSLKNQTFKKASRLAKRLLAIDPLHAGIRQELVGACLAQARKQVRSGRNDLAEKELAEAASWQRPEDRDGLVSINQAFLAWLSQRQVEGDLLLEQGVSEAGGGVAACLQAQLEGGRMGLPSRWLARLMATTQTAGASLPVTREAVLALARVGRDYGNEESLGKLLANLSGFWMKASRLDFSPEEMRFCCQVLAQARVYAVLDHYAALGEKRWQEHAVFVYYRLLAKYRGPKENLSRIDRHRLEKVLKQAREQSDRELEGALEDWLWDEDPFDGDFLPMVSGLPGDPRQVLVAMLTALAGEFLEAHRHQASRAMAKGFLQDIINTNQFPSEFKRMMGKREELIEEVLDHLFPLENRQPTPTRGSRPAGNRPQPTPDPAGRCRQLQFDWEDDA